MHRFINRRTNDRFRQYDSIRNFAKETVFCPLKKRKRTITFPGNKSVSSFIVSNNESTSLCRPSPFTNNFLSFSLSLSNISSATDIDDNLSFLKKKKKKKRGQITRRWKEKKPSVYRSEESRGNSSSRNYSEFRRPTNRIWANSDRSNPVINDNTESFIL